MAETQPITISPEAHRALTEKIRTWSGWRDATLRFGKTRVSPFAETDFAKREIVANPEPLILNPNRVLLSVTPFRLRQEAVLTGTLLHEAGHARHSRWLPNTREQAEANPARHSDGTTPSRQTVELARLMEEPRVEGLIVAEQGEIGAHALGWTMRASAAKLLPPTSLSPDPNQAIMDVIQSWALRAGRQHAYETYTDGKYRLPHWVNDFNKLLRLAIEAGLDDREARGATLVHGSANYQAVIISRLLIDMCTAYTDADTGPYMLDTARDVLDLLFPETADDEDDSAGSAMPSLACGAGDDEEAESGEEGEGDEAGQDGEGDTEPEDPGSGTEPGVGDSGEDEADPTEGGETSEKGDESADQDSGDPEEGDEGDEPGEDDGDSAGEEADSGNDLADALAAALAQIEADSGDAETESAQESADAPPPPDESGKGAGTGFGTGGGSWRMPTVEEREVQRGAERFLRDMIDVAESSKRTLTDQPSAAVDGAALAAWKAGGQHTEPRFFVRTHRIAQPSPPVQIAVLVDVSASMEDLQAPSALLSWALASAALNLRNFAGRGTQVQSTLIHWGSRAEVIAKNGQPLLGIREVPCDQGTSVMHEAMALVEQEIPGFFDQPDVPTNRLLVQFTDWQIGNREQAKWWIEKGLANGVNMLSVVPRGYDPRWAGLEDIMRACKVKRGSTSLIQYHRMQPEQVWAQAATDLSMSARRLADTTTTGKVSEPVAPPPFPDF